MHRTMYGYSLGPHLFQAYLDLGFKYRYIGRQLSARELMVEL